MKPASPAGEPPEDRAQQHVGAATIAPRAPVAIDGSPETASERLGGTRLDPDPALVGRLSAICDELTTSPAELAEAGRDWWPISIGWALGGQVPARAAALARPGSTDQVSGVLAACNDAGVPITPLAGRSGVCGGSVPVFGGVALDTTAMSGVIDLDHDSLVARVAAGTFGPDLEAALRAEGLTLGHWPQSMDLSTLGGWIACRGAGQYSTRYGKIEDMVLGLEVVLADGRVVHTGTASPRAAMGPDLTQVFVGSEGTLGVVTSAWLRLHPLPPAETRRAYGFGSFADGLDACRRILRAGSTPAVLRLYDPAESERNFGVTGTSLLLVLDEAEPAILEATDAIVDRECIGGGASRLDDSLVARWLAHRNDVSALAPLYQSGVVVDTIEVAGRWSSLSSLYESCVGALGELEGTLVASAHQSHSYLDGACIYFTFAGRSPDGSFSWKDASWEESYYNAAWRAVMEVVTDYGAAISHHHGIGLNRSRFLEPAIGESFGVLSSIKRALDPKGIMNPGKLGLPCDFGEVAWP